MMERESLMSLTFEKGAHRWTNSTENASDEGGAGMMYFARSEREGWAQSEDFA
jgi:hypothetical protein